MVPRRHTIRNYDGLLPIHQRSRDLLESFDVAKGCNAERLIQNVDHAHAKQRSKLAPQNERNLPGPLVPCLMKVPGPLLVVNNDDI